MNISPVYTKRETVIGKFCLCITVAGIINEKVDECLDINNIYADIESLPHE